MGLKEKALSLLWVAVSLNHAMPWARFYTRSLYWDMSSNRMRDPRGRVKLSHQRVRDIRKWKKLSEELFGRPIIPPRPTPSLHTDAADMGYVGTLNFESLRAGVDGHSHAQGIWSWRDRAEAISFRELKAVRMLLTGALGKEILEAKHRDLILHIDNQSVVHVTNAFVSASRPMMRELRKLKSVLHQLGLTVKSEWLPSVANKFADALSRRFSRRDLQIRRQLRRSVLDGMKAPKDVFPYRSLGEHPRFARQQAYRELSEPWCTEQVRLLYPPTDMIMMTVHKLRETHAPAIMLIPDWPRQAWYAEAVNMAERVTRVGAAAQDVWASHHKLNPHWKLLMLEINLA